MDSVRTPEEQKGLPVDELKKLIEEETGEKGIEGTNYQRRKRPRVAMMCALVFPGLGQVYNEKPFKAVLALAAETFYLSQILHNYRLEKREEKIRDSYPRFITIEGEEPVTVPGYDWSHHDAWVEEYRERQVDWIWWSAGCILVLVLDAYVDAHLDDMNFKIEGAATEGTAGLSLVIDF